MSSDQATCPICHSPRTKHLPPGYRDDSLYDCLDCELRFVYPLPTPQQLASYYDETYYRTTDPGRRGYDDYEADRDNLLETFRRRMRYIMRTAPEPGRILDVGCAHGFFLQAAREMGWDVYGLDISEHAVQRARETLGDNIEQGLFPTSDFPSHYFNVVSMWDYIEHTLDPMAELGKARELLVGGGILAIYTPELKSIPSRVMRHRWLHYKTEHLFYFSRRLMRKLLEQAGFNVLSVKLEGKHISFDFFLRRLRLYAPFLKAPVNRLLDVRAVQRFSLYLNPFDFMLLLARKTDGAGSK